MIDAIYGKKIGSTQIFGNGGIAVMVTAIEAEPCTIVQVKDIEKDGYNALKVGLVQVKEKKVNKPTRGIFEKAKSSLKKHLKEIRVESFDSEYKPGDQIDIQIFKIGDKVKISGKSKGKGFAGVIARHNFHRGPVTHGSHNIRKTGSVGMCSSPSRVAKGKKMPGRMGGKKVTIPPTEIIDIIQDQNIILVKGGVPGPSGNIVFIKKV
jgi:large subunit ribosomal protein L3